MRFSSLLIGAVAAAFSVAPGFAETIDIGIGHQSTVTNTVPGGIVLERMKLLEKHLPKTGKYEGATYNIVYQDYTSGPPITNQMLAGKLAFGVMGDYPLIVNGAKFEASGNALTRFIAITGYNLKGTGNGIVVPVSSDVYSLDQLAGKTISTPFGSAAWGMTLKALRDQGLAEKVKLQNQAPPVGVAAIAQNKIDAHADFCPWSEVMEFRGTGRKIFDGSEANVPTFHGTVVLKSFADKYPEIVEAYIAATMEAQDWITKNPVEAAIKVSEWTGIEKEVLYLYFSKGGISTFEPTIKPQWVDALEYDHGLLAKETNLTALDFNSWIDPSFVKAQYKAKGLDYDAQAKNVVSPIPSNPALPAAEVWIDGEGITSFKSVREMTEAVAAAKKAGENVLASYVYDHDTGLKLFGHVAFYAKAADGTLTPFMKKGAAEAFAKNGGEVVAWSALAL